MYVCGLNDHVWFPVPRESNSTIWLEKIVIKQKPAFGENVFATDNTDRNPA